MKMKRLKGTPSDKAQPNYFSSNEVVPTKENKVLSFKELKVENDLPLKRFKGTKWNGDEVVRTEKNEKTQKVKRKGVVDFTDECNSNPNKTQNQESNDFMSKLEQFSDVWNDCPLIKNPKENVESWHHNQNAKPLISNEMKDYNKIYNKNDSDGQSNNTMYGRNLGQHVKKERKSIKSLQAHENEKNPQEDSKKSKVQNHSHNILPDTENRDSNISDLKRKKAVQEHSQLYDDQKNIIKQALSSMDGKRRPNKKIVFDDAEELVESKIQKGVEAGEKDSSRQKLFEDDGSDVETDFKLNHQFKGRKGQKLMELQSKFASDSRFALDTRFYESGSDEGETETPENVDHGEEKKRQLEILESIVKQPIKPLSEMKHKKAIYSDETYLRFDPTKEEHKKYVITQPDKKVQVDVGLEKRNKKKNKKDLEAATNTAAETNKTKVTTEKFVEVKEDFKEALKKSDGAEFSLLKLFGPKESNEAPSKADESQAQKKLKYKTRNPFKYDSSESEPEEEPNRKKATKKGAASQPKASWRPTFFLTENDPRLEEAFDFLKCPEEQESTKEYAEKRKMLKDFIRHKFKNNNRKRTLFKKKLGGFKKKAFKKNKGKLS